MDAFTPLPITKVLEERTHLGLPEAEYPVLLEVWRHLGESVAEDWYDVIVISEFPIHTGYSAEFSEPLYVSAYTVRIPGDLTAIPWVATACEAFANTIEAMRQQDEMDFVPEIPEAIGIAVGEVGEEEPEVPKGMAVDVVECPSCHQAITLQENGHLGLHNLPDGVTMCPAAKAQIIGA